MPLPRTAAAVATLPSRITSRISTPAATTRGCRAAAGLPEISFPLHRRRFGLAVIVVKPLSDFFHYQRKPDAGDTGLRAAAALGGLRHGAVPGLAWFKRLAFIGFLAMVLRVLFGWFITLKWPSAEMRGAGSGVALLANLVLLFWRKDLSLHGDPVSPWNSEFVQYFIVSAACVVGTILFHPG